MAVGKHLVCFLFLFFLCSLSLSLSIISVFSLSQKLCIFSLLTFKIPLHAFFLSLQTLPILFSDPISRPRYHSFESLAFRFRHHSETITRAWNFLRHEVVSDLDRHPIIEKLCSISR